MKDLNFRNVCTFTAGYAYHLAKLNGHRIQLICFILLLIMKKIFLNISCMHQKQQLLLIYTSDCITGKQSFMWEANRVFLSFFISGHFLIHRDQQKKGHKQMRNKIRFLHVIINV